MFYILEKTFNDISLAQPTPVFFYTRQWQWPWLNSQEGLTHGAGVAMDFPIRALNGVVLSGAEKSSVPQKRTVFTAQLLTNEKGFKNQVMKYWKAPSILLLWKLSYNAPKHKGCVEKVMQKMDISHDAFQRPGSHVIWNIRLLFCISLKELQLNSNTILC